MPLESATYINQLQPTNPDGADDLNRGDDHIRLTKGALVTSLPNIGGVVTASHTELSYVTGVASPIQAQFTAKANLASPAFTGTPTTPTPTGATATQIANAAFVASSIASVGTLGDLVDVTTSTGITVSANTRVFADTSAGSFTLTIPAFTQWQIFAIKDAKGTWGTNKLIIDPGPSRAIENQAVGEVLECTDNYQYAAFKWDGAVYRIL